MKLLALDTSSIVATVAVLDGEKLVAEFILNHKKTHSQQLMPMLEEILKNCELRPKDIDVFGVSLGPGSFTGLRIGISTIKAMAQALNKPVVGICTLDGLAFNLPYCEGILCPIVDAQRDTVYTAQYKWGLGELLQIRDYEVVHIEELIAMLGERNEPIVFLGDGVEKFRDRICKSLGSKAQFAPITALMARASSIGELARRRALKGEAKSAEEILPIYMRKSQAEKQYEERMKGRV